LPSPKITTSKEKEMSNNKTTINFGLDGTLTIIFLVLKLTKVIDWSWWWVFSPIWIGLGILIVLGVIYAILEEL
jgi:hypothetical protein